MDFLSKEICLCNRAQQSQAHRKNLAYQKAGLMHDLLTGKVAVKVDAPIEQEA